MVRQHSRRNPRRKNGTRKAGKYVAGKGKGKLKITQENAFHLPTIKTKPTFPSSIQNIAPRHNTPHIEISGHNFSFEKKGSQYELSLGNWTDAGWHWDGERGELSGFFIRLTRSSIDWLEGFNGVVPFSAVKQDIIASAQKGDGMYMLSGDNVRWKFGTTFNDDKSIEEINEEYEIKADMELFQYMEGADYDSFEKSYQYKEIKKNYISSLKGVVSWDELAETINEVNEDAMQSMLEYDNQMEIDGVYKWKKANGVK